MYSIETMDLIQWLTKRIRITEKQKEYTTDLNLKIGKGGKLCVYKELLNYIKTHNEVSADELSTDAKKLLVIFEVISNHRAKLDLLKQNRAKAEIEQWTDGEIETCNRMIEVLASILSDLHKAVMTEPYLNK